MILIAHGREGAKSRNIDMAEQMSVVGDEEGGMPEYSMWDAEAPVQQTGTWDAGSYPVQVSRQA